MHRTRKISRCLKIAKVVSIFKKGDPNQVNNYRPIFLLSQFSKILEKLTYNRLHCYLTVILEFVDYPFSSLKLFIE